jgi:hypothetical protein
MRLEFDHIWGSEDNGVILEQEYVLNNNDTVKFNTIKYYISNVKLRKTDGTWWSAPESYYLVDASNSSSAILSINDIPKADYNSISFLIGVDSTRNVSGAQTGALAVSNNMFWSWNTGYIFVKVEGRYELTGAPNEPLMDSYSFHMGDDPLYRVLHFNTGNVSLAEGDARTFNIEVAVDSVFNGPGDPIDLSIDNLTHTTSNYPLAERMTNNFVTAFHLQ